tara:strand:+ start:68 stop:526 length:459 start_codon:yes stop_codon:yes gene_type:complete
MAPVLFRFAFIKDTPINEKMFGKNKTWRGLLVATVAGGTVFWLQQQAYKQGFTALALIDYSDFTIGLGVLMGIGAIVGDLIESYYKRKAGIAPGEPWLVFDQLDFVIGALVFGFFIFVPPAEVVLVLLIVSPLLHLVVNYIGYLVGLRKRMI